MKPAKHRVTAALYSMIDTPAVQRENGVLRTMISDFERFHEISKFRENQSAVFEREIAAMRSPDYQQKEYQGLIDECHVRFNGSFGSLIEATRPLPAVATQISSHTDEFGAGLADTTTNAWITALYQWMQTIRRAPPSNSKSQFSLDAKGNLTIQTNIDQELVDAWVGLYPFVASVIRYVKHDALALIGLHQELNGENNDAQDAFALLVSSQVQEELSSDEKLNTMKLTVRLVDIMLEHDALDLLDEGRGFLCGDFNADKAAGVLSRFFECFTGQGFRDSLLRKLLNLDYQMQVQHGGWYADYGRSNATLLGLPTYYRYMSGNLNHQVTAKSDNINLLVKRLLN